MFLLDHADDGARGMATVVLSPTDLSTASVCEYDFLRRMDARLDWAPPVEDPRDAMLERTSRLGDEHEHRVLAGYLREFGDAVACFERPERPTAEALAEAAEATGEAFRRGAPVVYQGVFFDAGAADAGDPDAGAADEVAVAGVRLAFVGYADFIVRESDGRYRVEDTKLARRAKVTALLQVAAYAEHLRRIGVEPAGEVRLLLGDGTASTHRLADIEPVYRSRRERLHALVREHLADGAAVRWGDPRFAVCGRCDACAEQVQRHRDVLLVAGLSTRQRAVLAEAGIHTIDELAVAPDDATGGTMQPSTLRALREQAAVQLDAVPGAPPPVRVYNAAALVVLPKPDPGDLFFDFEGDPLYTESARGDRWGLDYLFGVLSTDELRVDELRVDETSVDELSVDERGAAERFTPFWAHTFAQERQALCDFLEFVARRRAEHPGLHIYHYAAYERAHLLSLAARHGVGEEQVDGLLRENVLVDLYPIVRRSIRVGSRSYSLKKLEPLYMGEELRTGEVQNAAASIEEYAEARRLILEGDAQPVGTSGASQQEAGERMLDSIADYNRYDVVSTLRLRDWLLGLAEQAGVPVGLVAHDRETPAVDPSPLGGELLARAGDPLDPARTDDETAAAFAAAALDYHRREQKSFWWAHFARLVDPVEQWQDTRDVFTVTGGVVERDWFREGRQRTDRRHVMLHGQWAPGSTVRAGGEVYALYEYQGPFAATGGDPGARSARQVRLLETTDDGVLVEETRAGDVPPYRTLPVALTPGPPPRPGTQVTAIESWCRSIVDAAPGWPADPITDLLRRVPPRLAVGQSVAERVARASDTTRIGEVVSTIADLDDSYLAVQGPPGTGKSYLGAHVIAELVRARQWKVGVVAQSHAVVEHLLEAIVETAGLDGGLVAKVPQAQRGASPAPATPPDASSSIPLSLGAPPPGAPSHPDRSFTVLPKDGQLLFAVEHEHTGFVLGGTAWDFSNPARVPARSLDLLVVDEAGQFSLAATAASAVAASRLLLLGDPQQLPQVSQGTHPEPIDQSALGWISAGHDVLPAHFGFFLPETRRLHPVLAEPVSRLSYEGRLHAYPGARERSLDGVRPGLRPVPVRHDGHATESPEEAERVVDLVRSLLGRPWREGADAPPRPLEEADIIVVAAYNAQVALIVHTLGAAGLRRVRVGTVDAFQGQEAVVSIVSLAASSADDAPRGLDFLIMKNRLNVAISRAKWVAYLVYSPGLTEHLPHTPEGVAQLSAFLRLVEG
jgi:predicted RecB family nuclease